MVYPLEVWRKVTVTGSKAYSAEVPAEIVPELPVPPTTRTWLLLENRVAVWFVRGVLSGGTTTVQYPPIGRGLKTSVVAISF